MPLPSCNLADNEQSEVHQPAPPFSRGWFFSCTMRCRGWPIYRFMDPFMLPPQYSLRGLLGFTAVVAVILGLLRLLPREFWPLAGAIAYMAAGVCCMFVALGPHPNEKVRSKSWFWLGLLGAGRLHGDGRCRHMDDRTNVSVWPAMKNIGSRQFLCSLQLHAFIQLGHHHVPTARGA